MKLTAKDVLVLGRGVSAAIHGAKSHRGHIPWEPNTPESRAIATVDARCFKLFSEIMAKASRLGLSFDEYSSWEYDVPLSAFEARWVSWELVAYMRIQEASPLAMSVLYSLLRPDVLPTEYVEDLRQRLLAEADRLDAEAASVSDS